MVDSETGRVVDRENKGRGYELSKGRYVKIEEDELEAVQLESTHTIDIDDFVPDDEIDERYLDRPYAQGARHLPPRSRASRQRRRTRHRAA